MKDGNGRRGVKTLPANNDGVKECRDEATQRVRIRENVRYSKKFERNRAIMDK